MSLSEINNKINMLGSAWEDFKKANDDRLSQIEEKGSVDSMVLNKIDNIQKNLDTCRHRINKVEVSYNRPSINYEDGSSSQEIKDFCKYMRTGNIAPFMQHKKLDVDTNQGGAFLLVKKMADDIVGRISAASPLRQISLVETISTDTLEILRQNDDFTTKWLEKDSLGVVAETDTATFDAAIIRTTTLYAEPKASQRLLDDAYVNLEKWLGTKLVDSFANAENKAFIDGNGFGQPQGLLNYPANVVLQMKSGVNGSVTADALVKMSYFLKSGYMSNASFLMHRATAQHIRLLKDSNGHYIWGPGLSYGKIDTLLGFPVYIEDNMPIPANKSLSIVLGDFKKAYLIVDRVGISILRDPFTEKSFVKFYTTKRVGAGVFDNNALVIMQFSA